MGVRRTQYLMLYVLPPLRCRPCHRTSLYTLHLRLSFEQVEDEREGGATVAWVRDVGCVTTAERRGGKRNERSACFACRSVLDPVYGTTV